jgi:ABC-type branched-subunit amino acid transport system substrate-binding protein
LVSACGNSTSAQDLINALNADTPTAEPAVVNGAAPPVPAPGVAPTGAAGAPAPVATASSGLVAVPTTAPSVGPSAHASAKRVGKAPASHAPAARCNGAPITIGTVGHQSGILGQAYKPGVLAVEAWAAATNAAGGINCHKVKYLIGDDGSDPARQQALVRQFVEQDHVMAFVYMDNPITGQASHDYLEQKKIPVIGELGVFDFFFNTPGFFPVYTGGTAAMHMIPAAVARVVIPAGKPKTAVIVCQEVAYCVQSGKEFNSYGTKLGLDMVYNAAASLTQPNFTAQCLGAKNAGAQVIIGSLDSNSFRRLAADCARLSYKPIFAGASLQSTTDWKDDPNLDGAVIAMQVMPWFLPVPAVAKQAQAVTKYLPGQAVNAGTINGWTVAQAFEKGARTIGPDGTPSAATITAGMETIKGDDLGGLTYPLDFTSGWPLRQRVCGFVVVVRDHQFLSDGKMFCREDFVR